MRAIAEDPSILDHPMLQILETTKKMKLIIKDRAPAFTWLCKPLARTVDARLEVLCNSRNIILRTFREHACNTIVPFSMLLESADRY